MFGDEAHLRVDEVEFAAAILASISAEIPAARNSSVPPHDGQVITRTEGSSGPVHAVAAAKSGARQPCQLRDYGGDARVSFGPADLPLVA